MNHQITKPDTATKRGGRQRLRARRLLLALGLAFAAAIVLPSSALATYSLSWNSTPANPVALGNSTVGATGASQVTVTVKGSTATVTEFSGTANMAISFSGPDASSFVKTGGTCGAQLTGISILSSKTCTFILGVNPTSIGPKSAVFNVVWSTSNGSGTLTANVSGNGVDTISGAAARIQDTAGAEPVVTSHDFGEVAATQTSPYTFTLRNTGSVALSYSGTTFTGPDGALFSASSTTCGASIPVATTCTITATYAPVTAGSFASTMNVATGAGTKTVSLVGTGAAPNPSGLLRNTANTAAAPSHDFGVTNANVSSSSYTYTLANTGNLPMVGANAISITGANANQFSQTNNCPNPLPPSNTCTITVTYAPNQYEAASAVLNVGATNVVVAPSTLAGYGSGSAVVNDTTADGVAKRWLDTLTVGDGASANSEVRVGLDVLHSTDWKPAGLQVSTTSSSSTSAPADGTFQDVAAGDLDIRTLPGSGGVRSFVGARFAAGASGWSGGTSAGSLIILTSYCNSSGTGNTSDRRMWFRLRDSSYSRYSTKFSSVVRATRTIHTTGDCTSAPPAITSREITAIDGVEPPDGTPAQDADVEPRVPVTFTFSGIGGETRGSGLSSQDSLRPFTGVQWRIRNAVTGATFVRNGANDWSSCAAPCDSTPLFANGGTMTFADTSDGAEHALTTSFPSRGRWIVEGAPLGPEQQTAFFNFIGSVEVNSPASAGPTLTLTGTPPAHPATDQAFTITAQATDPLDVVGTFDAQGGRAQTIEWDLDGNHTNGPGNDGFEVRTQGDPTTGLTFGQRQRAFSTAGKTPGPYKIRVRVTDNGAFNGLDRAARTRTADVDFVINHPPTPTNKTVDVQADDGPTTIPLEATDTDGDEITSITVPPGQPGAGTLTGVLPSSSTYADWPATFTGIDTFSFVAHDDHNASATGTLTVRVHPNTTITSSDPSGAVTQKSASFTMATGQTGVVGYECRLVDADTDEVVEGEDWAACGTGVTGAKTYADLDDATYRFESRAVSSLGLKDGTPATHTWRVDNTVPTIVWNSGPNGPTNDTTPSFTLGADDKSPQETMTYECRVLFGDDQGWHPCGSPVTSAGSSSIDLVDGDGGIFGITEELPEGTYQFEARATDEVGLLGPVAQRTFRVDTTPPSTAIASGPEGLINVRDVTFSVTSTEAGSTFVCELKGEDQGVVQAWGPCPGANGSPAYTGLADDVYTFSVKAVDPATNVDPDAQVAEFEIDATPPETALEGSDNPTGSTQSRHATVTFSGTDNRLLHGFECRMDADGDDDWQPCESPESYGGLADGDHVIEIRAIDDAGNRDPSPEVVSWTIDHTAPNSTFDDVPRAVDNDPAPVVTFHADEHATFECDLDGAGWATCASPLDVSADLLGGAPLADGPHSLAVRATDDAGNVETTPAVHSWNVDTVVPTVTITAKPLDPAPMGDAELGFTAQDGGPLSVPSEVTAECAVDFDEQDDPDTWGWEECTSPYVIEAPADGPHRFAVRVTDLAGNVSAPQTYAWTVDASVPDAPRLDNGSPRAGVSTSVGDATVAFSLEDESDITFECRLDAAAWQPCESPYTVRDLDDGPHHIDLRARDGVGNISPVTSHAWVVNQTPPTTRIDAGPSGTVRATSAVVRFSSDAPGNTFECRIDGAEWDTCASPLQLADLADGPHSVVVRALDATEPAPLKDPSPVSRAWVVDATPPDVTIDSAPESTTANTATFRFSSTDPSATFECSIDLADYDACVSPLSLEKLAVGAHNLTVRAVDRAGNRTEEPVAHDWSVKEEVPISSGRTLATLTGGQLHFAGLDPLPLTAGQLKLSGDVGAGGAWHVGRGGVIVDPIVTQVELSPGTMLTLTVNLSATEDAHGQIPASGDGPASLHLSLQVQVEAKLGTTTVISAAQNCTVGPVTFDATGTYDSATKKVSLTASDVTVPAAGVGCGQLGTTVNGLLHLPGNGNDAAFDFVLSEDTTEEPPPTTTSTTTTPQPPPTKTVTEVITTPVPTVPSLGAVSTKVPKSGKVSVPVWCIGKPSTACVGTVVLSASVKAGGKTKVTKLGSAAYSVAAGKSKTIKVTLSKAAKKLLSKAPKKGLKVTVAVTPKGEAKPSTSRSLNLKPAVRTARSAS